MFMSITVTDRTTANKVIYIPSVYLIVEDELAEVVISKIINEIPGYQSVRFIRSGSWKNQMACLYGFFTCQGVYQQQFLPRFNRDEFREIKIVGVIDGDIPRKEIDNCFKNTIQGDFFPDKELKAKVKNSIISFNLELLSKDIVSKGLPEYYHKKWFEEISEVDIEDIYSSKMLDSEAKIIMPKHKLQHIKDCINFSKKIQIKNKDFHIYYNKMRTKVVDFCNIHAATKSNAMYAILGWIQAYNKKRWDEYTKPVKQKLIKLIEENKA